MQRPLPLINSFRETPVPPPPAEPRYKTHATARPVEKAPKAPLKKRAVKALKKLPYWIVKGFKIIGWLLAILIIGVATVIGWLVDLTGLWKPRTPDNF